MIVQPGNSSIWSVTPVTDLYGKKSALQIQCYTGMPQQLRNGMSAMYATKFTHIKMQPDVVIP